MNINYKPKVGDFCICLSQEYENVKLLNLFRDKDNKLYFGHYEFAKKDKGPGLVKRPYTEYSPPFFPLFSMSRMHKEELRNYFRLYMSVREKVEDYLINCDGFTCSIEQLEDELIKNQGVAPEEAKIVIKALIGDHILEIKKLKSGFNVTFSDLKAKYENSKLYYCSLADEIKVKSDRISLLVSHGQTTGNYREDIFMEFLRKYLPSRFSVATGFVEGLARQLDIIIFDSHNHLPLFWEGNLVVVRKEAVRGIIEIKTKLTASTLKSALQLFYDISRPGLFAPLAPIFKGIFAFDSSYRGTKGMATAIKSFYNDPYFEPQLHKDETRDILYLYHEISCVAVLRKQCVFSIYSNANGKDTDHMIPTLYSISDRREMDVQTAMFLSILYNYLDVELIGKYSLSKSFSQIENALTSEMQFETKLTDDKWLPRSRHENEHDYDKVSVRKRIRRIGDWFSGVITTTELISDLGFGPRTVVVK